MEIRRLNLISSKITKPTGVYSSFHSQSDMSTHRHSNYIASDDQSYVSWPSCRTESRSESIATKPTVHSGSILVVIVKLRSDDLRLVKNTFIQ